MYHYDNGRIYNCDKCRHKGQMRGCIFSEGYKPTDDNYPCDEFGNRLDISPFEIAGVLWAQKLYEELTKLESGKSLNKEGKQ